MKYQRGLPPALILAALFVWGPVPVVAQGPTTVPPDVTFVAPAGARSGTTVNVTVTGRNLEGARTVFFNDSGISARVTGVRRLPPKKRNSSEFQRAAAVGQAPSYEVTLEVAAHERVPADVYRFRLLTAFGLTRRVAFAVGEWPEAHEGMTTPGASAPSPVDLPATTVGTLEKLGEVDEYSFSARAGQELTFQVIAARIGSSLAPVLQVLDGRGNDVASRRSMTNTDFVLGARFEADGRYVLRVSDHRKRGGRGFYYRANIGEQPHVTHTFPLGVPRDRATLVRIEGFNLGSLKTVDAKAPATTHSWSSFSIPIAIDGARAIEDVRLGVSDYSEILEEETGAGLESATKVALPVVINGRIHSKETEAIPDRDVYQFDARMGEEIVIEVRADRLGSPLDSAIEVLDADGRPVPRVTLRATLQTSVIFHSYNALSPVIRFDPVAGIDIGDYLLIDDEVMRVAKLPEQPDAGHLFEQFLDRRLASFGTTPVAHALGAPVYRVAPYPPGRTFPSNGLPVVDVYWRNDDGPVTGRDSLLEFKAPKDGTYHVGLKDVRGFQGEEFAYRLILRHPRPDFRLMTQNVGQDALGVSVPRGSRVPVTVIARRFDGFDGLIEVELENLPEGLSAPEAFIGAGQDSTVVALSAAEDISLTRNAVHGGVDGAAPLRIVGRAHIDGKTVVRQVQSDEGLQLVAAMPSPDLAVSLGTKSFTLRQGEEKQISLRIDRFNGFEERVPVNVLNLPPGVVVVNSGLNGINIAERETEATFWLRASASADPVEQPAWVTARIESNNTTFLLAPPLLLKVVGTSP